jgi:predicted NBD/HSP70 family sugar kinase
VLARAAAGETAAAGAVDAVATALGRGLAGLVNALDPDRVTLGGLGADLLGAARAPLEAAYATGLMRSRRAASPAPATAALGEDGALAGAAERVWQRLLGPATR